MAQRLLEYNILATREHKRPIYSCVIYLQEEKDISTESPLLWKTPDNNEILRFQFGIIKLWEIAAEEILKDQRAVLLPLVPLTNGGKQRQVIEQMIHGIVDQREFRLLGLAKVFAGLVFQDQEDRDWLERRFAMLEDILEESWVIQETKKKGKIEGAHQNIKDFVQERFPDMLDLVDKQTNGINDLEVLNKLLKVIALAPDRKDILNALENLESGR